MIDLSAIVPTFSLQAYARLQYFETIAHDVSRYYHGHPVYLVGSALRDLELEPRDIDLVCVLPADTFRDMFGGSYSDWMVGKAWPDRNECWLRWAHDTAKRSEQLSSEARRFVDFRTMHEEHAKRYADHPRLRLSVEIVPGR